MKKFIITILLSSLILNICEAQVTLSSKRLKNRKYEITALVEDSGRYITGPAYPISNYRYVPFNETASMKLEIEDELILKGPYCVGKCKKVHYTYSSFGRKQIINRYNHGVMADTTYDIVPTLHYIEELQYLGKMYFKVKVKIPKDHTPWIHIIIKYQGVGTYHSEIKYCRFNVFNQEIKVYGIEVLE